MNADVPFAEGPRRSLVFLGLCALVYVLWLLQGIIVPFVYALILAVIISPMVDFLIRKRWPRGIAITIIMLLGSALLAAILLALISQVDRLSAAWPELTERFGEWSEDFVRWASAYFDIKKVDINTRLALEKDKIIGNMNAIIGSTLSSLSGLITALFLMPVYVFMILFYRPRLVEFVHRIFGYGNNKQVSEVLVQTRIIIQKYLYGLSLEIGILAVLNILGLMILGIDYAILLGIFGALLNLIPYLGGIIGMVIYMIVALLTKSGEYVLYVALLYGVIQFVDNNYIVPKVVGSTVKLNALASLLSVILGAALWGLPGMFLSIPLLAIMKLVFDRVEVLKPYGYLIGETAFIQATGILPKKKGISK